MFFFSALSAASCDERVSLADSETACNETSDCLLTSVEQCVCEPVTKSQLKAVNIEHPPEEVVCSLCMQQPKTATRRYFVPRCRSHECVVTDIRETDAVACRRDSDCRLRGGAECCASCNVDAAVAVSADDGSEALCPDGPLPCPPPCSEGYGAGLSAACDGGRCTVKYPATPAQ